jgi:5-methylcytosine-specific restriction endonuclease McrA
MDYILKPTKSLQADFNRRVKKGVNKFLDFDDFKNWYDSQEKICHYCGLKEEESQILVLKFLKSKRFPQDGILGRGTARGMYLEVDRINPKGDYSRENCVLCCYFCNNDKSDVFNGNEYKEFFQDRLNYLKKIIQNQK